MSLSEFVREIRDPAFWTAREPALHVGGPPASPLFALDAEEELEIRNGLLTEGWFQLAPRLPAELTGVLARAVATLDREGYPLAFIYVYDELWHTSVWFRAVLSLVLGEGFRQQPDFWAWHLNPRSADRGWRPHRDKGVDTLLPNRMPKSLSVWIPLTEATPLNGCMYLLPADRDPNYREGQWRVSDVDDVQNVRALPAAAGSLLAWNQSVLHWGGRGSPRAKTPRISYSIEYVRGDVEPYNTPLIDPGAPPPYERRLGFIGKQILQYKHMYGLDDDTQELGEALVAEFPI